MEPRLPFDGIDGIVVVLTTQHVRLADVLETDRLEISDHRLLAEAMRLHVVALGLVEADLDDAHDAARRHRPVQLAERCGDVGEQMVRPDRDDSVDAAILEFGNIADERDVVVGQIAAHRTLLEAFARLLGNHVALGTHDAGKALGVVSAARHQVDDRVAFANLQKFIDGEGLRVLVALRALHPVRMGRALTAGLAVCILHGLVDRVSALVQSFRRTAATQGGGSSKHQDQGNGSGTHGELQYRLVSGPERHPPG